jgi:hypothetical protein
MQNKENLIQTIQSLFPADSTFQETAEIGQQLLLKALFINWRSLPDEVLKTYSELCQQENR